MIRGRWRLIGLVLAMALCLLAFIGPSVPGERSAHHYLFVVDVTRSMNVPDYLVDGEPVSRLEVTRRALNQALRDLPCGSHVGVALFSGWQTGLVLNPVELCAHRSELDNLVADIDWRLGWVPQSNVRRALLDGMRQQARMDPAPTLVFMSDGDEAPLTGASGWAGRSPAESEGSLVLVGTGSTEPSNVPRLDQRDQVTGFLSLPSGAPAVSRLDQEHMQELAAIRDYSYLRLQSPQQFSDYLRQPRHATVLPGRHSLSPWLGAMALLVLVLMHFPRSGKVARSPDSR